MVLYDYTRVVFMSSYINVCLTDVSYRANFTFLCHGLSSFNIGRSLVKCKWNTGMYFQCYGKACFRVVDVIYIYIYQSWLVHQRMGS